MMTLALLFLAANPPSISSVDCRLSPGSEHAAAVCHWITDVTASRKIRWGTTPGSPSANHAHTSAQARTHSAITGALLPSTTYYVSVCSTDTSEACSSEVTLTTSAAPATYPRLPVAPAQVSTTTVPTTSTTVTVGSDCNAAGTGFQALLDANTAGDVDIVIPRTTTNCDDTYRLPARPGASTWVRIRSDATVRPPTGAVEPTWAERSIIWRTHMNATQISQGAWDALGTGSVSMASYGPGSYTFVVTSSWQMKKAALYGAGVAVTNATNATPIVITTATAHGVANGEAICIYGVTGNTAANGCWVAQNVTSNTAELQFYYGSNLAGNGAYVSGGTAHPLRWAAVSATPNAGPLSGACPTPGGWGHDTTAANMARGAYRCDTSNVWRRVRLGDDGRGDGGVGLPASVGLLAKEGARRYYITGIEFRVPEFPAEIEHFLGPTITIKGTEFGGSFTAERGATDIWLDQNLSTQPTWTQTRWNFWGRMGAGFQFTNNRIENGGAWCVATSCVAYGSDAFSVGVDMTNMAGPIRVENNYFHNLWGWSVFCQEPAGGLAESCSDVTVRRNRTYRDMTMKAGYAAPVAGAPTIKPVMRQDMEWKAGNRVLVEGNVYDGLAKSITPIATFVSFGSQFYHTIYGQASGEVVTIQNQFPQNTAIAPGDKVMVMSGTGGPGIFTVSAATADTFTLTGFSGSGGLTWCKLAAAQHQVSNYDVRHNIFKNGVSGVNFFGARYDTYSNSCAPGVSYGVRVADNIGVEGMTAANTDGTSATSALVFLSRFYNEATIDRNLWRSGGSAGSTWSLNLDNVDPSNTRLNVSRNVFEHGQYGVFDGTTEGTAALNQEYITWSYDNNQHIRAGGDPGTHPATTTFLTSFAAAGFSDLDNGWLHKDRATMVTDQATGPRTWEILRAVGKVENAHVGDQTATGFTLRWLAHSTTDPLCTAQVFSNAGRTTAAGSVASTTRQANFLGQQAIVTGLTAGTTYYTRIICRSETVEGTASTQ